MSAAIASKRMRINLQGRISLASDAQHSAQKWSLDKRPLCIFIDICISITWVYWQYQLSITRVRQGCRLGIRGKSWMSTHSGFRMGRSLYQITTMAWFTLTEIPVSCMEAYSLSITRKLQRPSRYQLERLYVVNASKLPCEAGVTSDRLGPRVFRGLEYRHAWRRRSHLALRRGLRSLLVAPVLHRLRWYCSSQLIRS